MVLYETLKALEFVPSAEQLAQVYEQSKLITASVEEFTVEYLMQAIGQLVQTREGPGCISLNYSPYSQGVEEDKGLWIPSSKDLKMNWGVTAYSLRSATYHPERPDDYFELILFTQQCAYALGEVCTVSGEDYVNAGILVPCISLFSVRIPRRLRRRGLCTGVLALLESLAVRTNRMMMVSGVLNLSPDSHLQHILQRRHYIQRDQLSYIRMNVAKQKLFITVSHPHIGQLRPIPPPSPPSPP
jgi:hypothetical protein